MFSRGTVDTLMSYFLHTRAHGAYIGREKEMETWDGCEQRDSVRSSQLFIYNEEGERAAINNNV